MSALDRPTADELRRGEIAAAVKNGRITPQEAESLLRKFGAQGSMDTLGPYIRQIGKLRTVLGSLGGCS